jgi:hypothetical protein
MDTLRPTEFSETGCFKKNEQERFVIKTRLPQVKRIDDLHNHIITPNPPKKINFKNPKNSNSTITIKNKKIKY